MLVKVIKYGDTFDSYSDMALKLKAKNWIQGDLPISDKIYEFINSYKSPYAVEYCQIRDLETGQSYIIGRTGITEFLEDFIKEEEWMI